MRWICRGATNVGRQLQYNADRLWIGASACAVVDGMGGQSTGYIAAEAAVAAFDGCAFDAEGRALDELAREAMVRAHDAVRAERTRKTYFDFAATAVLLAQRGAELAVAHVGDCRAYLLRDGALERLTTDHLLSEELARRTDITRAKRDDARARYANVITRSLGSSAQVQVDTVLLEARRGDVLVLCSDGCWKCIAHESMLSILAHSATIDDACAQLMVALREADDDHTVVVAKLLD